MKNLLQKYITYGLYPTLLITHIVISSLAIGLGWDLKKVALLTGVPQFILLFAIEFIFPLKPEWKMTRKSFIRDLKYFVSGGLTIFLTNTAIGYAAISLSENNVA